MVHNGPVDWRKPMIGVLAGLAALGDVNASTGSIPGGMWLSVYVACGAAVAGLALPMLKKISKLMTHVTSLDHAWTRS